MVWGMCHNYSHLWRTMKLQTVRTIYEYRSAGDWQPWKQGSWQGQQAQRGSLEPLTTWRLLGKPGVVARNVLHVEEAHNWLSQSQLIVLRIQFIPVNGYGIKIYDTFPRHITRRQSQGQGQGWESGLGVTLQTGESLWLDGNVAENRYQVRI